MLLHTPQGFLKDIGHSSVLDLKKNGTGTLAHKPDGSWNNVADLMMIYLRESGHPVFGGTSAFFRLALKSKEVEESRYIEERTQRRQSCYYASSSPSISSVSDKH